MDVHANQIEVIGQESANAEQFIELAEVTLALVGGGCGEIIVG